MALTTTRASLDAPAGSPEWRLTLVHRGLLAGAVALLAFRFRIRNGAIIVDEVDPSWWIGLGWVHDRGISFGTDTVFTYGPLGLLSDPSWASSRPWLALSLLASTAVALWFGWVVVRAVRPDATKGWGIVAALGLGLLTGWYLPLNELAALTMAIEVYTRLPSTTEKRPSPIVLATLGALVGVLSMGKVSTAVIAAVAVAILALAWGRRAERLVNLVIVAGAGAAAIVACWLLTGNDLAGLAPWARSAVEISLSYGTSMVNNAYAPDWATRMLRALALLVVLVVITQVARDRRTGWRAHLPEVALVTLMSWLALKAGVTRFDLFHAQQALLHLVTWAVLAALLLRWRAVALGALAIGVLAMSFSEITGDLKPADTVFAVRGDQPGYVATGLHAIVSPADHAAQVATAKEQLRGFYGGQDLAAPVLAALAGRSVAADGWDIAELWANDLDWHPLAILQTYSAHSAWLDARTAAHLRDPKVGPEAVLRRDQGVDRQWSPWTTPATEVALACSFETVAASGIWSALHRAPDLCGKPRKVGQVTAAPGERIEVPAAGPDELVVATFDVQPSLTKRALDLFGRDPNLAMVQIDGHDWRFLPTTATSPHLLRRPDAVGDRDLPDGVLSVDSLRFSNVGGPVTATFYAVPLG